MFMESSLRNFSRSAGFRAAYYFVLLALLGITTLLGANLVKCPDCGKDVSARAVSCPHCGCPGAAIAEFIRSKEVEKKPKSVVQIKASGGGGFGIAVEENGVRFVFLPVIAAGSGDTLNLHTLQGTELPYSNLEVARDISLIRIRVTADTLAYLQLSKVPGDVPSSFLGSLGLPIAEAAAPNAGRLVARLGADGGVMAINFGGGSSDEWVALNQPVAWKTMEPSRFRAQAGLLARLALRPPGEPLTAMDRTALEKADWICRDFRAHAQILLKPVTSTLEKKP